MPPPDLPDFPMESATSVEDIGRRFEELAVLQRMLSARDARLREAELELKLLRRNPEGGPASRLQAEVERTTLQAEVRRLGQALTEKEQDNADLAARLQALSADHARLTRDTRHETASEDNLPQSRTEMVLEIVSLRQRLARQRAALDKAAAKLDGARLSEPFGTDKGDEEGQAARAERRMRRQQMAMLTSLMASHAGRADRDE